MFCVVFLNVTIDDCHLVILFYTMILKFVDLGFHRTKLDKVNWHVIIEEINHENYYVVDFCTVHIKTMVATL